MKNNGFLYVLNSMSHNAHLITHDLSLVMAYLNQFDLFQVENIVFSISIVEEDIFYYMGNSATYRPRCKISVNENMYFEAAVLFKELGIEDDLGLSMIKKLADRFRTYIEKRNIENLRYKESIEKREYERLRLKYGK